MIITCQECESSFNVDERVIKETGSKVRCSKCSSVFVVYPPPASEQSDVEFVEETDDLKLDLDEDLESDIGFDPRDAELEIEESDDAELPELEDLMDLDEESTESEEPADVAPEELEIDLDLDIENDATVAVEESGVETGEEELDLDLELDADTSDDEADFELAPDDTADTDLPELDMMDLDESAEVLEVEATVEDSDSDLNLELDLDVEAEAEPTEAELSMELDESDELDLSDLEDIVASEEEPELGNIAAEGSEEADLDLDMETEAVPDTADVEFSAELEGADELDLSDLEDIITSEEEPVLGAEASTGPEQSDLDLELEFGVDEDSQAAAPAEAPDASDQLDMADLGKMLEADEEPAPESVADESAPELDLDLDLDFEPESAPGATASVDGTAGTDEADFLDIEKMLDESEETASGQESAEEIAELDLETLMDDASAAPELELDLDLEGELQEKESALDFSEAGESELEFELLDSQEDSAQYDVTGQITSDSDVGLTSTDDLGATTDDFATDEFTETRDMYGQTDIMDNVALGASEPIKTRRTRKSIPLLLLFVFFLVGVLIVPQNLGIKIPYLSDIKIPYISDIKIPYLSDLVKAKEQDITGNLKIAPLGKTITYQFIDNSKVGKLFVIKGQVRNDYDHPRSFIKITGKLYRKGQALVKTATVYGGNMLSDSELAKMDLSAINKRLQNRFGDHKSNIKVKTGKHLPFIIVFHKVPINLDEYTVEVAGSSS